MAKIVFPHTYAEILSSEQIDYMMEWMYSKENLIKQMDEGHIYFIAFDGEMPLGLRVVLGLLLTTGMVHLMAL
mgnify:CR=1 FL=1